MQIPVFVKKGDAMMDHYLTIHQFASLRGISIGSLHYYEKLGLLKPAAVDPKTHYRYYSPEQLAVLDAIQLCVSLDIPLKHLEKFMHDNSFDLKGVIQEGTSVLEDRIRDMKKKLAVAEKTMEEIESNQQYSSETGVYERVLPERWYDTAEIDWHYDPKAGVIDKMIELFARHQKDYGNTLFAGGAYITYGKEKSKRKILAMIRVMRPGRNRKDFMCLPAGTYICKNIEMEARFSLERELQEYFPWHKKEPVLISSFVLEKMDGDRKVSEIQILKEEER